MQADLAAKLADAKLKEKQATWESPRNLAIIIAAVAGVLSAVVGISAYNLGQRSQAPTIVFQPGAITVAPAPEPRP